MRIGRGFACGLASLCLFMSGCGGGDDSAPTELPATVSIKTASAVEVDASSTFTTDLPGSTAGLKFQWTFGDGSTSPAAAPSHAFASGGEYAVTLTVTNEIGVSRSASATVVASRSSMVAGKVCSGAAYSGWCWQRPTPSGNAIVDAFFIDASTGWAVGDAGQILKTTDGGASWVGQRSGVSSRLSLVRFADASNGWAVGDSSTILRTTDGGSTWVAQASGMGSSYAYAATSLRVLGTKAAVIGFNSYYGNGISTTDGGEHWTALASTPSAITPNGTIWSLGYNQLSKSTDAGATSTVSLQTNFWNIDLSTVHFADDLHGAVIGTDSSSYPSVPRLWRTADGGTTWTPSVPTGLPGYSSYTAFQLGNDGKGWLLGYGQIYRTNDTGSTWTPVSLPISAYGSFALSELVDGDSMWFSYGGAVYLTHDRGATWSTYTVSAENNSSSPRFQQVGTTLWLHYTGRSYRSTDNGTTWQRVFGADSADQNGNLIASWFFDAKKGLGFSSAGWVVETADAGQTWTRKSLVGNSSYPSTSRLQFVSANTGFLLSSSNVISKTTDGGATWWSPLAPVGSGYGISDFHFVDADHGWALSYSGDVYATLDGGQTWTQQTSQPTYYTYGIRFISTTTGVAVGSGGTILRTIDGGKTWSPRASGVTGDLRRVTFIDAKTAWAVGTGGAVTHSTDGGFTWTRVAVPSTARLNDVVFADAKHGWIVGGEGTVLATDDGGRSWQLQASLNSKTLNTAFFIDARSGWLMGDGGSVLATATGGN